MPRLKRILFPGVYSKSFRKQGRRNKYRAKRIYLDDHWFASHAEAERWKDLKIMQRALLISDLKPHPSFPFVVNGKYIGRVTPDFSYMEKGKRVVEDVKSKPTKTEAYGIRKRLFQALYPTIEFREILKGNRSYVEGKWTERNRRKRVVKASRKGIEPVADCGTADKENGRQGDQERSSGENPSLPDGGQA